MALSVDQPTPRNKKGNQSSGGETGRGRGGQKCMVENFKGEHRVHTDMRLRQQGRAHIDSTKRREGRTENIHITYTQWGAKLPILSTMTSFIFVECL